MAVDSRIKIARGDITKFEVDAIVNAANTSLLGGGGVDGAIHRGAGPGLLEECRALGGCPTGGAKITGGYNLPAKFVIHTVGPVWNGGNNKEEELLSNCYFNSMKLALDNNIASIAFPSISTGVYGFPFLKASEIALKTLNEFLSSTDAVKEVTLVTFSESDYENFLGIYRKFDSGEE